MKVYCLMEEHRAEGAIILGVFDTELDKEQVALVVSERSVYAGNESDRAMCSYRMVAFDVEAAPEGTGVNGD